MAAFLDNLLFIKLLKFISNSLYIAIAFYIWKSITTSINKIAVLLQSSFFTSDNGIINLARKRCRQKPGLI